ncbi:uncharacterized protein LOC127920413 isoform X23 [Oncorhynchus keta]|uniref:uncharacterized protein LOC127920413 isoform X19 n=1 Tax=Oncorhynchus keta TaxID=8018 RepID=UPI00227AA1A0|nr:uncharacterized protein LOC127920413 isoform X19 [Oncorhynchus keta]XP_052360457.1 uncharacterized protein LOC127920413 isoform X23 [Oncorhynchus keta]
MPLCICVCFCVRLCVSMSMSLHKWMTAGRGVVHAEMPVSEEPVQGLQLWVNLRREDKMVEPQYQELKDSQVPKPSREGVTVAVISGQALGVQVRSTILTITLGVQVRSTILTITLGVQVRSTILTITLGVQVRSTILTITLGVQVRSTILTITLGVQVRSTILTITLGVQARSTILTITLGVQVRSTILTITLGVQVRSTILTITRVVVVGVASCAVLEALFLAAETNCCCFKANFLQFYTFCRGAERTLYCVF